MPPHPPSGEQHEIRDGDQEVVVAEVGATLRAYSANGLDVLDGFSIDEPSSAGRGQVLAPWPNRLDGGRYAFDDRPGAAAIDEPELGNAIHGLVRWLPWELASKSGEAVALACVLHPNPRIHGGSSWASSIGSRGTGSRSSRVRRTPPPRRHRSGSGSTPT